jgi:hypothetical protein
LEVPVGREFASKWSVRRSEDVIALASTAVGATLFVWTQNPALPWHFLTFGVGLGVQRWVRLRYLLGASAVLFIVSLVLDDPTRLDDPSFPLLYSGMGLAMSTAIGLGRVMRERATA